MFVSGIWGILKVNKNYWSPSKQQDDVRRQEALFNNVPRSAELVLWQGCAFLCLPLYSYIQQTVIWANDITGGSTHISLCRHMEGTM